MRKKLFLTIILLIILLIPIYVKAVLNVDINNDGVTDINDVIAIAKKIINKTSISSTADVTGDGSVKVNDVMLLLNDVTSANNLIVVNSSNTTATSTSLYLNLNNTDASGNITAQLVAKNDIDGANLSGVTWISSKPSVATINSSGVVTAVSVGKTKITASSGGVSAEYTVKVKKKVIIVVGASQVNRLSCYVTDDTYDYAVSKTNYCSGTKDGDNTIHGSIVNGKYKYTTAATSIASVITTINNAGSLKRSSLTSGERDLLANYRFSDTLNFIHQSGSGFEFQVGGSLWQDGALQWEEGRRSGWEMAEEIIRSYSGAKSDVGFYIYFPIAGNGTKSYACNNWSDNYKQANYQLPSASAQDDADKFYDFVDDYLQKYSDNINAMRNEGYYVWGYIVSAHPLVPSNDTTASIKYSNETTACNASKRSNLKYYLFNEVIEELVENKYTSDYFKYVDTFNKIMDVTVDNSKTKIYEKYSFKFKDKYGGVLDSTLDGRDPTGYATTDGLHWDRDTVHEYLKLMIEDNTRLK